MWPSASGFFHNMRLSRLRGTRHGYLIRPPQHPADPLSEELLSLNLPKGTLYLKVKDLCAQSEPRSLKKCVITGCSRTVGSFPSLPSSPTPHHWLHASHSGNISTLHLPMPTHPALSPYRLKAASPAAGVPKTDAQLSVPRQRSVCLLCVPGWGPSAPSDALATTQDSTRLLANSATPNPSGF